MVPTGDSQPAAIIGSFCSVVEWGSVKFIEFRSSPTKVVVTLLILAFLGRFVIRRTSWRSVPPLPIVRRRRAGEIIRASLALYGRHPAQFVGVGVLYLPVLLVAGVVASAGRDLPVIGDVLALVDAGDPPTAVLSALIGSVVSIMAFVFVVAPSRTSWITRLAATTPGRSTRCGPLGAGPPTSAVVSSARWPSSSRSASRWSASPLPSGKSSGTSSWLRPSCSNASTANRRGCSSHLIRGRWLHTALLIALVNGVVGTVGLAVGVLLLVVFTGLPLWALSALVTLVDVLIMPLGAIVVTLLYGDAVAEHDEKVAAHDVAPSESVDV